MKPCPFCGAKEPKPLYFVENGEHAIQCPACQARGPLMINASDSFRKRNGWEEPSDRRKRARKTLQEAPEWLHKLAEALKELD